MRFRLIRYYETTAGTFYIGQSDDGRFHPVYNGESLGSYATDWQAAEDLAHGGTGAVFDARTGKPLNTAQLGIPDSVRDWEFVR